MVGISVLCAGSTGRSIVSFASELAECSTDLSVISFAVTEVEFEDGKERW
jgi:hypothetical protein